MALKFRQAISGKALPHFALIEVGDTTTLTTGRGRVVVAGSWKYILARDHSLQGLVKDLVLPTFDP